MPGGIIAAIILALGVTLCAACIIANTALRQQRDHHARRGLSNSDSINNGRD